jgi:hypothetical protein
VPGFLSHLDLDWDDPRHARFLNRLASFGRLIRRERRALAAALTSVVAAVTLAALPWGTGLAAAIVAGMSVGSIVRRRTEVSS